MKVFACLAVLALAVAGCSIHENAAPAPAPTTAYIVPAPTTTVLVPVN
jgi:hypothetical protein